MSDNQTRDTWFYWRCDNSDKLLLVDWMLFTVARNMPPDSFLARTYGNSMRLPTPLATHDDGRAIYHLKTSYAVGEAMLRYIRIPGARRDMARHLPRSLRPYMSLAEWRANLEYYGLLTEEDEARQAMFRDKRQRLQTAEEKLADLELTEDIRDARNVASTLAHAIFTKHPQLNAWLNGECDLLNCEYLCKRNEGVQSTVHDIVLHVGEPTRPVPIGKYIYEHVSRRRGSVGMLMDDGRVSMDYFFACMERVAQDLLGVGDRYHPITLKLLVNQAYSPYYTTNFWPEVCGETDRYSRKVRVTDYDRIELVVGKTTSNDLAHVSYLQRVLNHLADVTPTPDTIHSLTSIQPVPDAEEEEEEEDEEPDSLSLHSSDDYDDDTPDMSHLSESEVDEFTHRLARER